MENEESKEMVKPSDFFLGVVSFLGVLLPGAVFVFLRGESLRSTFKPLALDQNWVVIAAAAAAAYVAGQILLALTDPLNGVADRVAKKIFGAFEQPQPSMKTADESNARFHKAISYVRLKNAAAAGEIDHHMADYKLLRILMVVFLIDVVWSLFDRSANYPRILWEIVLALLSFVGFVRMRYWARLLALQYEELLKIEDKLVEPENGRDRTDEGH
jgi:hypothetical protein